MSVQTQANPSANRNATIEDEERAAVIPGYTKLPMQVLTSNCTDVLATMQADISEKKG